MSVLNKPIVVVDPTGAGVTDSALVDPTVGITQPGGPFPFGYGILADGAGGYLLAPTLRPYFLGFAIPTSVGAKAVVGCAHHGIDTTEVGLVVTLPLSLTAISVSVDAKNRARHRYLVEVISHDGDSQVVLATLKFSTGRCAFRADLSKAIKAGSALGVRIRSVTGTRTSTFSRGLVLLELEG